MPSFRITDLSLMDFRSYRRLDLHDLGQLVVFAGPNAAGKSNAVEAVQLLTSMSSFKSARSSDLVRNGAEAARASICATDGKRIAEVSLAAEEGKRSYALNGKPKRPSDLQGLIPSVTFTPDDLDIAKGSSGRRRRSLDSLGSQLNANYRQIVRDYDRILRQKNALLKDGCEQGVLEAVDETFATVASKLSEYRASLFFKMLPLVSEGYRSIVSAEGKAKGGDARSMQEEVTGEYTASLPGTAESTEEKMRGRALCGPHLDAVALDIGGLDASQFASQGQQRTLVLAWKLAEAKLIEEMLGTLPIMLLDDVMSELDDSRRAGLVSLIGSGSQAFLTTAHLEYFDDEMLSKAHVVMLPDGSEKKN